MRTFLVLMASIVGLSSLTSCAQFDPSQAKAKEGAPIAAEVEVVQLPYDPNLPRFVVAIEPFANAAKGSEVTSGNAAPVAPHAEGTFAISQYHSQYYRFRSTYLSSGLSGGDLEGTAIATHPVPDDRIGNSISVQFMTALSHWDNISVVEWSQVKAEKDGTFTTKLQPGEVGLFIIRGTVTEFNETAESDTKKRNVNGGMVGGFMNVVGVPGGAVVGALNPTYNNDTQTRKGMVGLDIQLVDARNGRILRSCSCAGTFTTMSSIEGFSLLGTGGGDAKFTASAVGQATRAAMNDAVKKLAEVFRRAPR